MNRHLCKWLAVLLTAILLTTSVSSSVLAGESDGEAVTEEAAAAAEETIAEETAITEETAAEEASAENAAAAGAEAGDSSADETVTGETAQEDSGADEAQNAGDASPSDETGSTTGKDTSGNSSSTVGDEDDSSAADPGDGTGSSGTGSGDGASAEGSSDGNTDGTGDTGGNLSGTDGTETGNRNDGSGSSGSGDGTQNSDDTGSGNAAQGSEDTGAGNDAAQDSGEAVGGDTSSLESGEITNEAAEEAATALVEPGDSENLQEEAGADEDPGEGSTEGTDEGTDADGTSGEDHVHSYEDAWDWDLDSDPVTAVVTLTCTDGDCAEDTDGHSVTLGADDGVAIATETVEATEDADGSITYTASVDYEDVTYTDEQRVALSYESEEEEAAGCEAGTYETTTDGGILVSLEWEEGAFAADPAVEVEELDSAVALAYVEEALEGEDVEITAAYGVDITFYVDGAEAEPASAVKVGLELPAQAVSETDNVYVVHKHDDEDAVVLEESADNVEALDVAIGENNETITVDVLLEEFSAVVTGLESVTVTAAAAASSSGYTSVSGLEINGITYTMLLYDDGTATIRNITDVGNATSIAFPSSVTYGDTEYTVDTIYFLSGNPRQAIVESITSLSFPSTVTSIQGYLSTFKGVTSLTVPGTVTSFAAAMQSTTLTSLTFEEGVEEISKGSAFLGCTALTSVSLPGTLTTLGTSLFSGCTSLTSITLPASITEIPSTTFKGCTSLTSVTALGTITSVGNYAFRECTALTTIPDLSSVTSIGTYAFYQCSSLSSMPDLSNVTSMGTYAFAECSSLAGELDLSSLDEIPNYAFYKDNGNITAITFSTGLTSIGNYAFYWFTKVTSLSFPSTLESIGNYAFYCAYALTSLILPDSVTSLGTGAFSYAKAVTTITIGSGLTSLNANMFANCTSLEEITIDNSEDNVTFTNADTLTDAGVTITYLQKSVSDNVGDTISNEGEAETLQEAVNAAGSSGTVTISKDIKLTTAVTVSSGTNVTITAEAGDDGESYQISGAKSASNLGNLFIVEEGASLTISGAVELFGRYNTGSVITTSGSLTIADDVSVTKSTISSKYSGVIVVSGSGASLTISGGSISNNTIETGYSGVILVEKGGAIEVTGGTISDNEVTATGNNSEKASSGILLYGTSSGTMSGGTISGNTARRGSAIYLTGDDSLGKAEFTLNGGTICGNTTTSGGTDYSTAAGAVYVNNNASFTMNGGTICNNTASSGSGGGVTVVDWKLQNNQGEYGTSFVMNGGTITGNKASSGGGIYSYSNGVVLNAGSITDNEATTIGGGVYVEGNEDAYSTMHMYNVLISDNTASVTGGGMWICPTGNLTIRVTNGGAVYDNAASGAGDDIVYLYNSWESTFSVSTRVLGGGRAAWFKDGNVYIAGLTNNGQTNRIEAVNSSVARYTVGDEELDIDEIDGKSNVALKDVLADSAAGLAQTEATLLIQGNSAPRGGGVAANGGVVIGLKETTSLTVTKVWEDNDDADGIRPESITLNLYNTVTSTGEDGNETETKYLIQTVKLTEETEGVTVNEDGSWSYTFTDLPVKDTYSYSVGEEDIDGYVTTYGEVTDSISSDGTTVYTQTVTNTRSGGGELVDVTIEWDDLEDADGLRPDSVTVTLYSNGEVLKTVTISASDGWYGSTSLLGGIYPAYDSEGKAITYSFSVSQNGVDQYATSYADATFSETEDGLKLTSLYIYNVYRPKVSVNVTKVWDDDDNADGLRPDSVTVTLYQDGEATDQTLELSEDSNWAGSFEDLEKYSASADSDGTTTYSRIVYSVRETSVYGYSASYASETSEDKDEIDITVTNTPGYGTPSVNKTVSSSEDETYSDSVDASPGDTVCYEVSVTATAAAHGYVLHDTMSGVLSFGAVTGVYVDGAEVEINGCTVSTDTSDGCTFEVTISDDVVLGTLKGGETITVRYTAVLSEDAEEGTEYPNAVYLEYDDPYYWDVEGKEVPLTTKETVAYVSCVEEEESDTTGSSATTTSGSSSSAGSSSTGSSSETAAVLAAEREVGESAEASAEEAGEVLGAGRDMDAIAATGDDSNVFFWLLLMSAAVIGLGVVMTAMRRNRRGSGQ